MKCKYCGNEKLETIKDDNYRGEIEGVSCMGDAGIVYFYCPKCRKKTEKYILPLKEFLEDYKKICLKHQIKIKVWYDCDGPVLNDKCNKKNWEKDLDQQIDGILQGTIKRLKK